MTFSEYLVSMYAYILVYVNASKPEFRASQICMYNSTYRVIIDDDVFLADFGNGDLSKGRANYRGDIIVHKCVRKDRCTLYAITLSRKT